MKSHVLVVSIINGLEFLVYCDGCDYTKRITPIHDVNGNPFIGIPRLTELHLEHRRNILGHQQIMRDLLWP